MSLMALNGLLAKGAAGGGSSGTLVVRSGSALSRVGWTVSASRTYGGGSPNNAINGNQSDGWATGGGVNVGVDYFEVDQGSAGPVGGVQMNNYGLAGGDFPLSGDVRYWNGSTWVTVASWVVTHPTYLINVSWAPVTAQRWRLYATGLSTGGSGNWWSIIELFLYSDRAPWALFASNNATDTRDPYKANDANTVTVWQSGAAPTPGTTFFKVDLGVAELVGGFKIDDTSATGDMPTAGNVQYSDDNSSWSTAASWVSGDISSGILKKSWTPSSHRYWRLLAQATCNGGAGNWWSIGELYLYSDAAP